MRIAQIAPIIERVPPKKYGGTERVVHALTEELVKRGHDVTLFASGDSQTSAKLVSVYPRSLREARFDEIYGANHLSMLSVGLAYAQHKEFDVIHDHNWTLSLPTANLVKDTSVVMTHHGPFPPHVRRMFEELRGPSVVTISRSQASQVPGINHVGTVYNGLDLNDYPFSATDDGYLLWVGRFDLEKAPHLAIDVARYLDMPLILAGKLEAMPAYENYFNEYIRPKLGDGVTWVGEVGEAERNKLMSRAKAFLHPVMWPEPFGLTMIEAMACGAPVIGFGRGSIPEVVKHGVSGFVVDDVEGMISAVENISLIDRFECRAHVLENFSAEKMADGYEDVYYKLLCKNLVPALTA